MLLHDTCAVGVLTRNNYIAGDAEQDVGVLRVVGDDSDILILPAILATRVKRDMNRRGLTLGEYGLLRLDSCAAARSLDLADDEI